MQKIRKNLGPFLQRHKSVIVRRTILTLLIFAIAWISILKLEKIADIILETGPLKDAYTAVFTPLVEPSRPDSSHSTSQPPSLDQSELLSDDDGSESNQRACTEMGCTSSVFIDVSDPYRWVNGAYKFQFNLDGKKVVCEANFSSKACKDELPCSQPVIVMHDRCGKKQRRGYTFSVSGDPKSIKLDAFFNGKSISRLKYKPSYKISRPNGPECAPVCRDAIIKLRLKPGNKK